MPNCLHCKKVLKEKQICTPCYIDLYCPFCSELTLKSNCTGHEIISRKENRFMEDKPFVEKPMFGLDE